MNKPINYPLAKLCKEKGFDEPCPNLYYQPERCKKPTIADVVMWLYEKHGIWIAVDWMSRTKPFNSGFYCNLRGTNKPLNQDNFIPINNTKSPGYEVFNSPTEAYEAAIEYTLTKLI